MKHKDVVNTEKVCGTCEQHIKEGEPYLAIVADEDWEERMDAVQLLTEPHKWSYYHNPCTTYPRNMID